MATLVAVKNGFSLNGDLSVDGCRLLNYKLPNFDVAHGGRLWRPGSRLSSVAQALWCAHDQTVQCRNVTRNVGSGWRKRLLSSTALRFH